MVSHAAVVSWIALALMIPALVLAEHRVERSTRGRHLKYHAIYWGSAVVVGLVLPSSVSYELFSPLTVIVIGSIFPIYESIRAICTPQGQDDKSWVQYWIAQATLTYATEWVDDIAQRSTTIRIYFYMFEFFFLVWLMLPWTDGACLIYERVTQPLCKSWIDKAAKRMNSWLTNIATTFVSAVHLWLLWGIFSLFFPPAFKRFITVSVGIVYPVMASIVAVSTEDTYDDDTFWLTYWSCYGCLYLIMCFLETWLGRMPGFYTLVLLSSVYLMLPGFRGAEKIFRNILVPLTGLQEMLLMRDALVVKREIMKQVPKGRRRKVRQMISESFAGKATHRGDDFDDDDDTDDEDDPLVQYGMYGSTDSTRIV